MFSQAFNATLRILAFRAGPQDFPYSPQLPQLIVPLAVLADYLVFVQVMPPLMSLVMSVTAVCGIAAVTRGLLRARGLENRYNQALCSLLACRAALNLIRVAPFAAMAPVMLQVAENPQLLQHLDTLPAPQGAAFIINLLSIWSFAVNVHVARQAADVGSGVGVLITILATLSIAFMVVFTTSFFAVLLGPAK